MNFRRNEGTAIAPLNYYAPVPVSSTSTPISSGCMASRAQSGMQISFLGNSFCTFSQYFSFSSTNHWANGKQCGRLHVTFNFNCKIARIIFLFLSFRCSSSENRKSKQCSAFVHLLFEYACRTTYFIRQ